ncbi:MAG TPA: PLP-dependent aminotransferase family protein [Thermoanaerobaculia bacterium]|jgi:GntR family transcriptional regulator/MocR family aminotransferase|nr:PLP-dependent aminotransferase family protein [Thermoanaerobaculia bacterium]
MAKQTTAFELMLPVRDRRAPAYRWLYGALRTEILEGRLRPGARLPGTRDLAEQYGLSRGTIVSAFEQLKSEGYVEGSVGSGTYVSKVLPDHLLEAARASRARAATRVKPKRRISEYAARLDPFSGFDNRRARAFRTDLPALDLFPTTLWTQISARRLRRLSTRFLLGCEPLGHRPLRNAVADYLTTSRGVKCEPEQVAIVSGVLEALDLVARLFLNPNDRVCIEDPGYQGAAILFEGVGAKVFAVPLDEEGMKLPRVKDARLVYITPAHQFPVGTTMTLARRLELLEWARKSGALIFEDDYDSEYRYSGRPVPALQGLDPSGQVLFFGTFSKVLFPALRLGYLVLPRDLVSYFESAIAITRRHAPLVDQAVLCDFITEGHFARHLRRMRQIYAERLSVLLESARERLAGLLDISDVEAGLQTAGWLRDGINGESAAKAAAERGVEVTPLSRYSRGAMSREGLQLGFAAVDAGEIRRGVRELAIVLEGALKR